MYFLSATRTLHIFWGPSCQNCVGDVGGPAQDLVHAGLGDLAERLAGGGAYELLGFTSSNICVKSPVPSTGFASFTRVPFFG